MDEFEKRRGGMSAGAFGDVIFTSIGFDYAEVGGYRCFVVCRSAVTQMHFITTK